MNIEKPRVIQRLEKILKMEAYKFDMYSDKLISGINYVEDEPESQSIIFNEISHIPEEVFHSIKHVNSLNSILFLNCSHFNFIDMEGSSFTTLIGTSFMKNREMSTLVSSFHQWYLFHEPNNKFLWFLNGNQKYISGNTAKNIDIPLIFSTALREIFELIVLPPPSVIRQGSESIKNYYDVAKLHGDSPISEGRIIVIGDGAAGKSSLIEKILYNQFEEGKLQTNGVNVEDWKLSYKDRDVNFHFWDFGGQEIQHAVHKFFFTEGCLYILVLDNRKEEEPEYWLEQIKTLGGSAPVMIVFNKADENRTEVADRKYLKEKYENIVGFYATSCKTGFGIEGFKENLEKQAIELRTVHERLPNNWLSIKKELEKLTSGEQHYMTYEVYKAICEQNHVETEEVQKLLLRYFNTLGVVTWFGETYMSFMHVLSPAWITQGVYKIITADRTALLFGQIQVTDFPELLYPIEKDDFTYEEEHYGYLLSMMKKFDLCYSPDDKKVLIPSGFGKEPKVEYQDFKGAGIRTYILQFQEYLPMYLIHRYIAQKLHQVHENNFWYSGIVAKDSKSASTYMVHADKKARRIYVRIKGSNPLGVWEHVRREIHELTMQYAHIPYDEKVVLEGDESQQVDYQDLVAHLQSKKMTYFHPGLKKDFNVGYLMGFFESQEETIENIQTRKINLNEASVDFTDEENGKVPKKAIPEIYLQILNNNTSEVSPNIQNQVQIEIDINIQQVASQTQGEVEGLLEELQEAKEENKELKAALEKVKAFTEATSQAKSKNDVVKGGWGRKLKKVVNTLKEAKKQVKNIEDGKEMIDGVLAGLQRLAGEFDFTAIAELIAK